MIKKLLSLSLVICAAYFSKAQSFNLVYQFNNVTASTGTIDPTPTPTATGITSGSFTAVGLSANPTTTNVFAFTGWTTAPTPDLTKYFEITITPQSNYAVTLTHMSFYMGRSNFGPQTWCVRTNKDSYTNNAVGSTSLISPSSTGSIITVNGSNEFIWGTIPSSSATASSAWRNNCAVGFTGPNYSNQASPFNIRFYAYTALQTSGSFRIDSVVVYGSATFSIGAGLPTITHDINAPIKLFPNPSNDGSVYLESKNNEDTSVEIYNAAGVLVNPNEKIFFASKTKLDLNNLPNGVYLFRFKSGGKYTHTEKLIIGK